MSRVRAFVAAQLPEAVTDDLGRLQERLRRHGLDARWASTRTMHLTVRFLGELEPATFDAAAALLGEPIAAGGPVELVPRGVGAFPSTARARVVWTGLEGDVAALARAALEAEARLESVGIPREARPFRPHLTLGRAARGGTIRGAATALEREADYRGPAFPVAELVLFESRLRPQGAEHIPRAAAPLA